jgi:anti-sigma28 factor (negative regulator of flagellin synthesis)
VGDLLFFSCRIPAERKFDDEKKKLTVPFSEASQAHPLLPQKPKAIVATEKTTTRAIGKGATKVTVVDDIDPLSMLAADPLSRPPLPPTSSPIRDDPLANPLKPPVNDLKSQTSPSPAVSKKNSDNSSNNNSKARWEQRKQQLKKEFSVVGKIKISNLSWNADEGTGVEDGTSVRRVDKFDKRLASLEKRQEKKQDEQRAEISQSEYEHAVNRLSVNLDHAWAKDERVESLKIAIQLGKLLSNTSVPQFYPCIFITVTEVLNHFGDLVFQRLLSKSEETILASNKGKSSSSSSSVLTAAGKLRENWTSEESPSVAKDTCRNWLYKTACIRDLLPRIVVEIALLRCYRFITDTDAPAIMNRIGNMIRGLGDPLVANYVRLYLVLVGSEVAPEYNGHAIAMCQDILFTFRTLKETVALANEDKSVLIKLDVPQYLALFTPVFEWIISCVGKLASKELFQNILQLYRDHCNDSIVLYYIMDGFDAAHWVPSTLGMITLIKSCDISCVSIAELFTVMGKKLAIMPPPEDLRLPILNDVWKIVSKHPDLLQYVKCAVVWLDFVQKHYGEREIIVLLGQVSSRVSSSIAGGKVNSSSSGGGSSEEETDVNLEPITKQIELLITHLIGQSSSFGSAVLSSESLLKMLDIFKGIQKVQLCKEIIDSFHRQQKKTNDPVLINTLFDLARTIHDSVDGLSPITDVHYNSFLIISFIDLIDFGRDLEQQLNFYVECRGAFPNLDAVKDKLILLVNKLTMKCYMIMKGKHTKKTLTFVKACLAYSHITAPSLLDNFRKLELSIQCAEIALLNQCLPQTDTFLKSAISLIPDLPLFSEIDGKKVSNDEKLIELILNLLSFLVIVPGHPEYGPFYIIQGLLNAMKKYPWYNTNQVIYYQMKIYMSILNYLSVMGQKSLPYHYFNVQSNDELYGNNQEYMKEVFELSNSLVDEIIMQLTKLAEKTPEMTEQQFTNNKLMQIKLSLDFVNILMEIMRFTKKENVDFVQKLMDLCQKNKHMLPKSDQRYLTLTNDLLQKNTIEWKKKL